MKVEKTKEFIQKDEQTKNFILFVLKKTMFKNIKSSKLDYLSDKKITSFFKFI